MTTRIAVATDPRYEVVVGAGALERAREFVAPLDVLLRDSGLPDQVGLLAASVSIALPPGEEAKDWETLGALLGALAHEALDRSTRMCVVGGGAALDVGGLAAALYLRGIEVVYCPTTLLAMVDASVGGKTAINLPEGKNLVGVVRQPRAVFADTRLCASQSEQEFRSGLGEALKCAVLGGERSLAELERDATALSKRDPAALERTIVRCVRLKARIVARDPLERGVRRVLNLGHTFAHAIERVARFGRVPHGVAVAAGLGAALELSRSAGVLRDAKLPARVRRLAARLSLPQSIDALREEFALALPPRKLLDAMRHDKKALAAEPRFVLPERAGKVLHGVACAPASIEAVLAPKNKRAPGTARPRRA